MSTFTEVDAVSMRAFPHQQESVKFFHGNRYSMGSDNIVR